MTVLVTGSTGLVHGMRQLPSPPGANSSTRPRTSQSTVEVRPPTTRTTRPSPSTSAATSQPAEPCSSTFEIGASPTSVGAAVSRFQTYTMSVRLQAAVASSVAMNTNVAAYWCFVADVSRQTSVGASVVVRTTASTGTVRAYS